MRGPEQSSSLARIVRPDEGMLRLVALGRQRISQSSCSSDVGGEVVLVQALHHDHARVLKSMSDPREDDGAVVPVVGLVEDGA